MKKQYKQPSMTAVELQDICNGSIIMTSESAVDGQSLVRGTDFNELWNED